MYSTPILYPFGKLAAGWIRCDVATAVAERGSMFNPSPRFYMKKIAVSAVAAALKSLGGQILGKLWAKIDAEANNARDND